MSNAFPRRSFLAACALPGAANLLAAPPEMIGSCYLATSPEGRIRDLSVFGDEKLIWQGIPESL